MPLLPASVKNDLEFLRRRPQSNLSIVLHVPKHIREQGLCMWG